MKTTTFLLPSLHSSLRSRCGHFCSIYRQTHRILGIYCLSHYHILCILPFLSLPLWVYPIYYFLFLLFLFLTQVLWSDPANPDVFYPVIHNPGEKHFLFDAMGKPNSPRYLRPRRNKVFWNRMHKKF